MEVHEILANLRRDREQIEQAILCMEKLARGQKTQVGRTAHVIDHSQKQRGRPPGSKNKVKADPPAA